MSTAKIKYYLIAIFMFLALPGAAHAGHLFTQASANTPINLTAGNGIQVTQLTYEGQSTQGNVLVYFSGNWGSGDAMQINIGSWSRTFTYDSPLAGTSQSGSALSVNDPTLTAAGITTSPSMQWTVIATAGTFTFEGYRIYVSNGTFNGTGAAPINQSQVVSASSLGGGGFVPNATSQTVGLAKELEALSGGATGDLATIITAISNMTPEQQQQVIKQLSPETSQAIGQAAVNTAVAAMDTVQIRLDSLRTGVGVDQSAHSGEYDMIQAEARASRRVAHDEEGEADSMGLSAGNDSLKNHMWMKAFGGEASHDAKGGFAGSKDHVYGTMIGYDTTVNNWLMGVALGYAKTNVNLTDYRSGDGADVQTYQATGYFGRSFGSWYLNGMFTYAMQDYETVRNTHTNFGVAQGDFNGDLYGLRVIAGMPISFRETLTLTPYAGLEVNYIKQDAYTETGAGVLSLNVQSDAVYRIRSLIGAELASLTKLSNGTAIRPSVRFNWRHEFNDDGVNTTTSLVGGGNMFETVGQNVDRDVFGVSARLVWERTETMNISVEAGVEGASGYSSWSGQVMAGWRF
jgi:outer membrane autotransporter protein